MDMLNDVGEKLLRWKIEVIKVVMICETMPPVATVLTGYIFVTLLRRRV
jgi:hypothetical protein